MRAGGVAAKSRDDQSTGPAWPARATKTWFLIFDAPTVAGEQQQNKVSSATCKLPNKTTYLYQMMYPTGAQRLFLDDPAA